MTYPTPRRTAPMRQGRQADSARRRQRVITALGKATTAAGSRSASPAIARTAGVDRSFLYRHRDLLEKIHALEATPAGHRRRASSQPRLPASRSARRPSNAPPASHARIRQLEEPPVRTARRTSMARIGARDTRRHRRSSTSASATSSSRPSTCACNSGNANRISPPRGPPTANSWPSSTRRHDAGDTRRVVLAPHLSRSITSTISL